MIKIPMSSVDFGILSLAQLELAVEILVEILVKNISEKYQ